MSSGSVQARERAQVSIQPNPEAPVQRSIPVTGNTRGSSRANVVAEEAIQQGDYRLHDEAAAEVTRLFLDFLHTFSLDILEETDENTGRYFPYKEQVLCLVQGAGSMQHLIGEDEHDDPDESSEFNPLRLQETTTSFPRTLFVDFHHVYAYDADLAEAIESDYTRFEPSLRLALHSYLRSEHFDSTSSTSTPMDVTREKEFLDALHIAMINMPSPLPIRRAVRTENIARLISICGTVTRSSDVRPELLVGSFRCSQCSLDTPPIPQQYHYTRPTVCRNQRCYNRSEFQLQFDKSIFTDWQKLRVQENSDEIPPGSMPRSLDIIVRGDMVERAKAGDRIVFTGTLVVIPDASALARAGDAPRATRNESRGNDAATGGGGGIRGLKSLGVRELTYRTCFVSSSVMPLEHLTRYRNLDSIRTTRSSLSNEGPSAGPFSHSPLVSFFHGHWSDHGRMSSAMGRSDDEYRTTEEVILEMTEEEQDDIRRMRGSANLLQKMCQSICPYTYGHDDIKRGILLQLLGGVHKTTAEGMKLRGDINICIVGDPSTAKSQFLKYVHSFLPNRSVYTSGKASSAAGLTAAVQRDQDTGEFCIEAGALMLADNGICCIDEFDKMDPHDQVAIHEAMEQQTISITKAGIQATLNARASILAAANPIYGRYDRSKTLKANVSLSAPILSRFDLFFVVLDNSDETSDYHVAKHILDVHRCEEQVIETPFSIEQMQRYIRFAKTINPKLSEESRKNLIQYYRILRQNDAMGRGRTAYRITVRQLESMIRLSEAMARLFCDEVVRPQYVRDAYRLLQKSIIHVESDDVTFEDDDDLQNDDIQEEKREEDDTIGPKTDQGTLHSETENVSALPADTSLDEKEENTSTNKVDDDPRPSKKLKRSKKKVKISYEEYVAISKTITTYLCKREKEDDSTNPTWGEVLEWYLVQRESEISDSEEALNDMKKLATLVFRRMIQVDKDLIYVSDGEDELNRKIAVHPNFPR